MSLPFFYFFLINVITRMQQLLLIKWKIIDSQIFRLSFMIILRRRPSSANLLTCHHGRHERQQHH